MSGLPSHRTWAPGDLANAVLMNANVRDPITFYKNPPCCFLARVTAGSPANDTWTGLDFPGGTLIDTDNQYSGSGSQLTIRHSGIYDLRAAVVWSGNTAGNRAAKLEKVSAGVTTVLIEAGLPSSASDPAGTSGAGSPTVDTTVRLGDPGTAFVAGDKLQMYIKQNSGGALALSFGASDTFTYLCMRWVAA